MNVRSNSSVLCHSHFSDRQGINVRWCNWIHEVSQTTNAGLAMKCLLISYLMIVSSNLLLNTQQKMWIGSGMAQMMFPGAQQYMAHASVLSMHHPFQLPTVPVAHHQSVGLPTATNQSIFCYPPASHAVNMGSLIQTGHPQQFQASYHGFHHLQPHSQVCILVLTLLDLCIFCDRKLT